MKKTTLLFTVAATAVLLAASPAAKAISPELGLVTPGDTFTFDIAGFNATSGVGYILGTGGQTATFGQTQTLTGVGANGQNYTVTSGETMNLLAGTTTDSFSVTTPTSFLTTTTVNGTKITALQLDIGDANSGVGVSTGANTVDFLVPVTGYTSAGSFTYSGGTQAFTAETVTLTNSGMSLAASEGVSAGTTAVSTLNFTGFAFSITYPTLSLVPEPSTWAMCGLGLVGGAVMIGRRRLAA